MAPRTAHPYADTDVVDARAPRFNQATVGVVSLVALLTGWWWLLALVEVPDQTIAADYALTAECLAPRDQEWLEHGPGDRAEREALLVRYAPRAEVMLEVLEGLRRRHGGVEAYLRQAGVTPEDLEGLRARLVAPG